MIADSVQKLTARIAGGQSALASYYSTNFTAFVRAAWKATIRPEERLVWCWAYDLWCEYLTLVAQGRLLRLIGNTPPRFLKSTITNIAWPCWVWTTRPHTSFLCASYSMDLSVEHSIARRNLIMSNWYQSLWGERFCLSGDRNLTSEFTNNKRGAMVATAVGARTLGKGADHILGDDLMNVEMALSEAERRSTNLWMDSTLMTRLNNPSTGAIVLISQRTHELDTTGYVLETQPGRWTHVKLPLVAEEDETWQFPVSGKTVKRARGQVLEAQRFPPAVVEEIQARRYVYAGQYQQEPAPLEGNLIKRADVRYYGGIDRTTGQADERLPEKFDRKLISVDCAFKDLATSDFVAIGVIGVKGRKRYVLNVINRHLDAAATEMEIRRQHMLYGPISAVLVEDKANGSAVIARLKANVSGVIAVNPQGGKVARMYAGAPEWQAGDWHVDRNASWSEPFIEQITMFPSARHDDMADMMSQASIYLQSGPANGLFDLWREMYQEQQGQQAKAGAQRGDVAGGSARGLTLEESDGTLGRAQKEATDAWRGLVPPESTKRKPAPKLPAGYVECCPACGNTGLARQSAGNSWQCCCGARSSDPKYQISNQER